MSNAIANASWIPCNVSDPMSSTSAADGTSVVTVSASFRSPPPTSTPLRSNVTRLGAEGLCGSVLIAHTMTQNARSSQPARNLEHVCSTGGTCVAAAAHDKQRRGKRQSVSGDGLPLVVRRRQARDVTAAVGGDHSRTRDGGSDLSGRGQPRAEASPASASRSPSPGRGMSPKTSCVIHP
jgi:hypothetical protein